MTQEPPPVSITEISWTDVNPLAIPQTIDEARHQMVTDLHRAIYGDVWARPEPPAVVWAELLARVSTAARCFRDRRQP